MSRESLQNWLHNPLILIAAILIVAILLGLVLWLLFRSRRGAGEREEHLRAELVEMEREHQFAAATEHMPYAREAVAAANEAAQLFREYIGLPVLAIYAGREHDARLNNVLPKDEPGNGATGALDAPLPESLDAAVLGNFWKPQQTKLGFFTGELAAGSFVTGPLSNPQAADAEGDDAGAGESAETPGIAEGQGTAPTASRSAQLDIIIFPWRAAYDWTGIILAQASQPITP
jgi:hypothetical protein